MRNESLSNPLLPRYPRRSDRCGDLQPDKEDSDKVRNYSMRKKQRGNPIIH